MLALCLFGIFILSSANASLIVCDSEDIYDPINKMGIATFDFEKNEIVNKKSNSASRQVIFGNSSVCGKDTSTMEVKPECDLFNEGGSDYVKYSIECEQQFENGQHVWFSRSSLIISSNKIGLFNCSLKYPTAKGFKLQLKNCYLPQTTRDQFIYQTLK